MANFSSLFSILIIFFTIKVSNQYAAQDWPQHISQSLSYILTFLYLTVQACEVPHNRRKTTSDLILKADIESPCRKYVQFLADLLSEKICLFLWPADMNSRGWEIRGDIKETEGGGKWRASSRLLLSLCTGHCFGFCSNYVDIYIKAQTDPAKCSW